MIHTDGGGLPALGEMLKFLEQLKSVKLPPVADIGFVDDGSPQAGEVMNLIDRKSTRLNSSH